MLAVIDFYPDAEFSGYGLRAEKIHQMRERFAEWRTDLLRQPDRLARSCTQRVGAAKTSVVLHDDKR